jgi:regulator of sigma E protease
MWEIVTALVIISILILIHELGHFLAAKAVGIKVEEFGVGYPPRAWGKKIKGTIYSINWLPFGGFVRLLGEDEKSRPQGKKANKQAFYAKTKPQKALVILAGVFANFLLAVACFAAVYTKIGIPEKTNYVLIREVAENSPAQAVNIQVDDVVIAFNGVPLEGLENLSDLIDNNRGKEIALTLKNAADEKRDVALVPRNQPPEGEGPVGVALTSDYENNFYPWWQMPIRGAWVGLKEAVLWGWTILEGLGSSIRQLFGGTVPEIGGPIRIVKITGDIAQQGWVVLLKFVGVLSINLAILNILPFPALDGGRLTFLLLERFIKKNKRAQVEHTINSVGMAFLVLLMVLITANDASFLIRQTDWWAKITSFLPF